MNVTLRLYKRHDLDLIPVVMSSSFRLTRQIKAAIRAYLNDEPFRIPIESVARIDNSKNVYLLHFCINREKEPDLFAFVTSLKSGKRNSALKNLLRYYLDTMYLGEYMDDKGLLHYPSNIPQTVDAKTAEEKEIPIPTGKRHDSFKVLIKEKPLPKEPRPYSNEEETKAEADPIVKENTEASKIGVITDRTMEEADAEDDFDFMDAMENLLDSARQ